MIWFWMREMKIAKIGKMMCPLITCYADVMNVKANYPSFGFSGSGSFSLLLMFRLGSNRNHEHYGRHRVGFC
jgi:hypothetical protein